MTRISSDEIKLGSPITPQGGSGNYDLGASNGAFATGYVNTMVGSVVITGKGQGNISPKVGSNYTVGTDSKPFNAVYANNIIGTSAGDFKPQKDDVYNIGSPDYRWHAGYFGTGVVQVGGSPGYASRTDGVIKPAHSKYSLVGTSSAPFYAVHATYFMTHTPEPRQSNHLAEQYVMEFSGGGFSIGRKTVDLLQTVQNQNKKIKRLEQTISNLK